MHAGHRRRGARPIVVEPVFKTQILEFTTDENGILQIKLAIESPSSLAASEKFILYLAKQILPKTSTIAPVAAEGQVSICLPFHRLANFLFKNLQMPEDVGLTQKDYGLFRDEILQQAVAWVQKQWALGEEKESAKEEKGEEFKGELSLVTLGPPRGSLEYHPQTDRALVAAQQKGELKLSLAEIKAAREVAVASGFATCNADLTKLAKIQFGAGDSAIEINQFHYLLKFQTLLSQLIPPDAAPLVLEYEGRASEARRSELAAINHGWKTPGMPIFTRPVLPKYALDFAGVIVAPNAYSICPFDMTPRVTVTQALFEPLVFPKACSLVANMTYSIEHFSKSTPVRSKRVPIAFASHPAHKRELDVALVNKFSSEVCMVESIGHAKAAVRPTLFLEPTVIQLLTSAQPEHHPSIIRGFMPEKRDFMDVKWRDRIYRDRFAGEVLANGWHLGEYGEEDYFAVNFVSQATVNLKRLLLVEVDVSDSMGVYKYPATNISQVAAAVPLIAKKITADPGDTYDGPISVRANAFGDTAASINFAKEGQDPVHTLDPRIPEQCTQLKDGVANTKTKGQTNALQAARLRGCTVISSMLEEYIYLTHYSDGGYTDSDPNEEFNYLKTYTDRHQNVRQRKVLKPEVYALANHRLLKISVIMAGLLKLIKEEHLKKQDTTDLEKILQDINLLQRIMVGEIDILQLPALKEPLQRSGTTTIIRALQGHSDLIQIIADGIGLPDIDKKNLMMLKLLGNQHSVECYIDQTQQSDGDRISHIEREAARLDPAEPTLPMKVEFRAKLPNGKEINLTLPTQNHNAPQTFRFGLLKVLLLDDSGKKIEKFDLKIYIDDNLRQTIPVQVKPTKILNPEDMDDLQDIRNTQRDQMRILLQVLMGIELWEQIVNLTNPNFWQQIVSLVKELTGVSLNPDKPILLQLNELFINSLKKQQLQIAYKLEFLIEVLSGEFHLTDKKAFADEHEYQVKKEQPKKVSDAKEVATVATTPAVEHEPKKEKDKEVNASPAASLPEQQKRKGYKIVNQVNITQAMAQLPTASVSESAAAPTAARSETATAAPTATKPESKSPADYARVSASDTSMGLDTTPTLCLPIPRLPRTAIQTTNVLAQLNALNHGERVPLATYQATKPLPPDKCLTQIERVSLPEYVAAANEQLELIHAMHDSQKYFFLLIKMALLKKGIPTSLNELNKRFLINAVDPVDGLTALEKAINGKYLTLVRYLMGEGAKLSPDYLQKYFFLLLQQALLVNEIIPELEEFAKKPFIDTVDSNDGLSALAKAVKARNLLLSDYLLSKGARLEGDKQWADVLEELYDRHPDENLIMKLLSTQPKISKPTIERFLSRHANDLIRHPRVVAWIFDNTLATPLFRVGRAAEAFCESGTKAEIKAMLQERTQQQRSLEEKYLENMSLPTALTELTAQLASTQKEIALLEKDTKTSLPEQKFIYTPDFPGETPIMAAIRLKNEAALISCLAAGKTDVNQFGGEFTALHSAVKANNVKAVELLLGAGADCTLTSGTAFSYYVSISERRAQYELQLKDKSSRAAQQQAVQALICQNLAAQKKLEVLRKQKVVVIHYNRPKLGVG